MSKSALKGGGVSLQQPTNGTGSIIRKEDQKAASGSGSGGGPFAPGKSRQVASLGNSTVGSQPKNTGKRHICLYCKGGVALMPIDKGNDYPGAGTVNKYALPQFL
jgi:hypothetical protein